MIGELISSLVFAAVKAAAPIIRKKVVEGYKDLKDKAAISPGKYDDIAVYLLGVGIGEEGE